MDFRSRNLDNQNVIRELSLGINLITVRDRI